jgi:hypothetical protein
VNTQTSKYPSPRRTELRVGAWRSAVALGVLTVAAVVLAGCGGSSGSVVTAPYIAPARISSLGHFQPAGPVVAGRPTTLSFTIEQASGQPLTSYRTCCEPHQGVDLIIVRSDDSHVQYDDSDIAATGRITQPIVFPAPGPTGSSPAPTSRSPPHKPRTTSSSTPPSAFEATTGQPRSPRSMPPTTSPATASRSGGRRICTPSRRAS